MSVRTGHAAGWFFQKPWPTGHVVPGIVVVVVEEEVLVGVEVVVELVLVVVVMIPWNVSVPGTPVTVTTVRLFRAWMVAARCVHGTPSVRHGGEGVSTNAPAAFGWMSPSTISRIRKSVVPGAGNGITTLALTRSRSRIRISPAAHVIVCASGSVVVRPALRRMMPAGLTSAAHMAGSKSTSKERDVSG